MNSWITYLWQSNLCLLVFFLGYTLWLSKEQCFNYRRIYLAAGCLLSEVEDWRPGILKGRPVAVKMVLPIIFKLNQVG